MAAPLAGAIGEKQGSSQEVVDAYLRRIEAMNGALNALARLAAPAPGD